MTTELFRDDAYLKECEATVVSVNDRGGIVLDRTVFYPTGGGQPGDSGVLLMEDGSEVPIATTVKGDGPDEIVHVPAEGASGPTPGQPVVARIDWDRRYRHMRMHSAMHVLCSVVKCGVTGGQVGTEKSRLDFDIGDATLDKEQIQTEVSRVIAEDKGLAARWVTDEEMKSNPELVRTMSVARPRGSGKVRLMEIEGVDLQACGGTHVNRTGEIGAIRVGKIENKGKRNRRVNIHLES